MATSETAAATGSALAFGQQSGWLAGFLAMLAQTTDIVDRAPVIGFVAMGILGAFAGWALAMESGKFDAVPSGKQARSLFLRLGIGVAIGVAVGVYWLDQPMGSRGMWMLVAGIMAAAPVDMFRAGIELLTTFLRQRVTGSGKDDPKP